jgi:mannosyl-3-phosphoglycerate synthase
MVRIKWASKAKSREGRITFESSGRCSKVVNYHLNQLLEHSRKSGSCSIIPARAEEGIDDHICTGNAGEHAMTMSLALKLRLASGYATEPFHFMDILERLAGDQVQILQLRTISPHFHDTDKGEARITNICIQGLSAIYHSPVTAALPDFRRDISEAISVKQATMLNSETKEDCFPYKQPVAVNTSRLGELASPSHFAVEAEAARLEPQQCRIYPPAGEFNLEALETMLLDNGREFWLPQTPMRK